MISLRKTAVAAAVLMVVVASADLMERSRSHADTLSDARSLRETALIPPEMLPIRKNDAKDSPTPTQIEKLKERLKQLEEETRAVHLRIRKELETEAKAAQQAIDAAKKDFDAAVKSRDAAAIRKTQEALAQAHQARSKLLSLQGQFRGGAVMIHIDPPSFFSANPEKILGITTEAPREALAAQLALPKDQGRLIVRVDPKSNAGKAGLRRNDVLTRIGGKETPSSTSEFRKLLSGLAPDAAVEATVIRGGKTLAIQGLFLRKPEEKRTADPKQTDPKVSDKKPGASE